MGGKTHSPSEGENLIGYYVARYIFKAVLKPYVSINLMNIIAIPNGV